MNGGKGLWDRSRAWRLATMTTIVLTLVAVLLLVPGGLGSSPVAAASYVTPPPASASMQSSGSTALAVPSSLATPTVVSSRESQDPVFDLAVATSQGAEFPAGTELHIAGVYKASLPPGQKDEPWWSKCTDHGNTDAMRDCHSKYAGLRTPQVLSVNVRRGSKPLVLALMAYEPVIWKIDAESGSNIRKVILAGYHAQDIQGLRDDVPVAAHTYESSPCRNCSRQTPYFYGYEFSRPKDQKVIAQIEALTGLRASSVQGTRESRQFNISGSMMNGTPGDNAESYVGQVFTGSLSLAERTIMLPDGDWHGVTHVGNPVASGRDEFLVLARIDAGQLAGLLAVRVQTSLSRTGFPEHQACNQVRGYAVSSDTNVARGDQSCYWVTHVVSPWSQPVFGMAAEQLTRMQVKLPYTVISSGFRQANGGTAVSMTQYANPELARLRAPQAAWQDSDWHPVRLGQSPERQAYVDGLVNETRRWHQIIKATPL